MVMMMMTKHSECFRNRKQPLVPSPQVYHIIYHGFHLQSVCVLSRIKKTDFFGEMSLSRYYRCSCITYFVVLYCISNCLHCYLFSLCAVTLQLMLSIVSHSHFRVLERSMFLLVSLTSYCVVKFCFPQRCELAVSLCVSEADMSGGRQVS